MLGEHGHRTGPVDRHRDDLGAHEGQGPTHLGEAEVVANGDPEPAERRRDHGSDPVAGRHETIGPEHWQVRLADERGAPVGTQDCRGVAEHVARTFEEPDHDRHRQLSGCVSERPEPEVADRDRRGERFVTGRELVPGERALGQHQEIGVSRSGVLDRTLTPAGVDRDLTLEDLELADREHCRRRGRSAHQRYPSGAVWLTMAAAFAAMISWLRG